MSITVDEVRAAWSRVEGAVRRTPILHASLPTVHGVVEVAFKLEHTQLSGSFKARGVLNAVLRGRDEGFLPDAGLVIASGGNAGIAAAVAGGMVSRPVTVAVPAGSPEAKVQRLRQLGASVDETSGDHRASNEWADRFAATTGALRLHAYDLPDVIAGAGTLLLEAADQDAPLDEVVVAVGGGGLVAGTCLAASVTRTHVVAAEPTGAATLHAAIAASEPVDVVIDSVAADALGARRIGQLAWRVCAEAKPASVIVPDSEIIAARELMWEDYRLLVEHAAACAVAAITSGAHVPTSGARPLIVLCGGNTARASTAMDAVRHQAQRT